RNTWLVVPSESTATVFPFRSRIARTRSVPNSSKQPTCTPASRTTGAPASSCRRNGPPNHRVRSTSPAASAICLARTLSSLTYCTSVKPLPLQEFFGHVLGGHTEAGTPDQPEPRRLGWWLGRDRPGRQAEQPRRPRHRQPAQEASPRPPFSLWGTHRRPPFSHSCQARRRVGAPVLGPGGCGHAPRRRARGGPLGTCGRSAACRPGSRRA